MLFVACCACLFFALSSLTREHTHTLTPILQYNNRIKNSNKAITSSNSVNCHYISLFLLLKNLKPHWQVGFGVCVYINILQALDIFLDNSQCEDK